jgi:hypothetical protein
MRDNDWLENRLDFLIKKHFSDVDFRNPVFIKFGRHARTRLGSIKKVYPKSMIAKLKGEFSSVITMNGHFQDESIPEYNIDAVIAHELCHYAHGFSSPLPQMTTHPHRGGVVDKEMINRGFGDDLKQQKKWFKDNWIKYLKINR